MTNNRKQKLIELGSETLADALHSRSKYSKDIDDVVYLLITTPKEIERRLKQELTRLQNLNRHVDERESKRYSKKLPMMLSDIQIRIDDPHTGIELIAMLYEAYEAIYKLSDNFTGSISNLFYSDVQKLFVDYATRCSDKQKVANTILELNEEEKHGYRGRLMYRTGEYLPEEIIRSMIDTIQERADREAEKHHKRHHLYLIEELAREIKDVRLFEETRIASEGELTAESLVEIARIHLESDDLESALFRLKNAPEDVSWPPDQEELLEEIYRKQGDSGGLAEVLFQKFRSHATTDNLQALLDVIGHDKRDSYFDDEVRQILNDKDDGYWATDAEFMIAVGKIDEAATYLLKKVRAGQISVNNYSRQASIAEAMASGSWFLVASLLYRIALVHILERGIDHGYWHPIKYLKRLDELSDSITEWEEHDHHDAFKDRVRSLYGFRRIFWANYEQEKAKIS